MSLGIVISKQHRQDVSVVIERDVRLLFQANHWSGATIKYTSKQDGWLIELQEAEQDHHQVLTLKRGSPRIFKTSDTALSWCRDIGFEKIIVELHKLNAVKKSHQTELSRRILLVDDDSNDIDLTFRAIQKLDSHFDIVVCRDGQDALDFLSATGKYKDRDKAELPRLILLDLNLPKVTGYHVLQAIREHPDTKYIPVVILSVSDSQADIAKCYSLGINSYITKPIDYQNFSNTIQELGQYWLDTNIPPVSA